jgi:hypothetical protein
MKLCDFRVFNMNIHVFHSKTMSHPIEHIKYQIHTNIVHINHNK